MELEIDRLREETITRIVVKDGRGWAPVSIVAVDGKTGQVITLTPHEYDVGCGVYRAVGNPVWWTMDAFIGGRRP